MSAASLLIILAEAGTLLGITVPVFSFPVLKLLYIIENVPKAKPWTLFVSFCSILLLLLLKKLKNTYLKRQPGSGSGWDHRRVLGLLVDMSAVVVIAFGSGIAYVLHLQGYDVMNDSGADLSVMGHVEGGLPALTLPSTKLMFQADTALGDHLLRSFVLR